MKKFEFVIPEDYKDAVEWQDRTDRLDIDEESAMKFLTKLLELRNLRKTEKEKWLEKNQNELEFSFYFEDVGYAFVDTLTVTDSDGNIVHTDSFLGEGNVEDYLDQIGIVEYYRV